MFRFAHSHAYPGCRVRVEAPAGRGKATAEFSDGSVVPCAYERVGSDAIRLAVSAYVTRARTTIAGKTWLLKRTADGEWKVARRVPSAR